MSSKPQDLSPTTSIFGEERAIQRVGAVEADIFVINDVVLSISPDQISVDKQSFNHEWQTLRTRTSQKVKSGHSVAYVSLDIIFKGDDINEKMSRVIAGLRACPFASIYNRYLTDILTTDNISNIDESFSSTSSRSTYDPRGFQPIVLAFSSGTISTMGHEDAPDCVRVQLNFIWFNYKPYTPVWAYKCGENYDTPGYAWESNLWKKFYEPYYQDTTPVDWPHQNGALPSTKFMWREYAMGLKGSAIANEASVDLLETILKHPEKFVMSARELMWAPEDKSLLGDNKIIDLVYRKAVREGWNTSKEIRDSIKTGEKFSIDSEARQAAGGSIKRAIGSSFQGEGVAGATKYIKSKEKSNIEEAVALLKKRIANQKNLSAAGFATDEAIEEGDFVKVYETDARYGVRDETVSAGTFSLMGRKKWFAINPDNRPVGQATVVEQITITFSNILALIPMVGYRYPTCQHIGSVDADVTFVMNATNDDAAFLNQMYDEVESMALRFRSVPAGFLNLYVDNDFLRLFNIEEFLTKNISTNTLPDQPGRSRVVMSLSQTGVTSKTILDDPSRLVQENVKSDTSLNEDIWKAAKKYLSPTGAWSANVDTTTKERIDAFFTGGLSAIGSGGILTKNVKVELTDPEAYFIVVSGIKLNNDNRCFLDAAREVALNYNKWLVKVHEHIFEDNPEDGAYYFDALRSLQKDASVGFVPGLSEMIDSVKKRGNARIKAANTDRSRQNIKKIFVKDLEVLDNIKKGTKRAQELRKVGDTAQAKKVEEDMSSRQSARKNKLGEMGVNRYLLDQGRTLRKISDKYLSLDQFKHLEGKKEKLGLDKGVMAYPDFAAQLSSVAGLLPNNQGASTLLDIDPDVYLWYPMYSGTASTDTLIGSEIRNAARKLSERVYNEAQGNVNSFFTKTYLGVIANHGGGPEGALKLGSGNVCTPDIYSKYTYDCATNKNTTEKVKKTLLIDGMGKAHLNVPIKDSSIVCPNSCVHTTDFLQHWSGTEAGANPSPDSSPKDISGTNKHGTSSSTKPTSGGKRKGIVPGFTVDWGSIPRQVESARDATSLYYCPVQSFKSKSVSGSCAVRDLGSTVGITSTAFRDYRRRSAVADWPNISKMKGAKFTGWISPDAAAKSLGKPWNQWTLEDYRNWSVKTGRGVIQNGKFRPIRRGVGYQHKGMDVYGALGTPIYAIADGTVTERGYGIGSGNVVGITHTSGTVKISRYLHLQEINPKVKRGQSVRGGECIGVLGISGQGGSGYHLHFETWASKGALLNPADSETGVPWNVNGAVNIKRYKPPLATQKKIDKAATSTPGKDVTSTLVSPMTKAIQDFEQHLLNGQAQSMTRAYPTFKLYFIEDDSNERKRLAYDDFFSYSSVKSIRVVKSRRIAADLCEIFLTNVSGVLSNRKFKQQYGGDKPHTKKGEIATESSNGMKTDTVHENPIASLLLQAGQHISLRLGYSSDPDNLDTVFNGVITEIEFSENEDLIRMVAQSYAIELVQDIKGIEEPTKKTSWGLFGWDAWGLANGASTAKILEEVISEPEVLHFGRWSPGAPLTGGRDLLTDKWQWEPNPADDNIFAPPSSMDLTTLDPGNLALDKLEYTIYRTTIWDIFQEMTLRHPNFIASAVPYKDITGERMTMFFGLPNQLYFARAPNSTEQVAQEKLIQDQQDILDKWAARRTASQTAIRVTTKIGNTVKKDLISAAAWLSSGSRGSRALRFGVLGPAGASIPPAVQTLKYLVTKQGSGKIAAADKAVQLIAGIPQEAMLEKNTRQKRLNAALSAGFIKPFRSYHLITSSQHLIANNIRANSRDVANTIMIKYGAAGEGIDKFGNKVAIKEGTKTFTLKLDNALPTEEIRTQWGQYINVTNEELAKRYALGLLCQNLKDVYKGDLQIIGDGSIKPYDVVYLLDEYTDMVGAVEVESVVHVFDQESGFRTEIKPDMLVQAAEWSMLSSMEAMGVIAEGVTQTIFGPTYGVGRLFGSLGCGVIASGLGYFGGFLTKKIINYTQLAQPVIMSPLMLHGRVFAGGVPTRKIPMSLWESVFGDWRSEIDEGFTDWQEDVNDNMVNGLARKMGYYSQGTPSFWSNS